MLATAVAQIRLAFALLRGRPVPAWALSALIDAAVATRHEFGALGTGAAEAVTGPTLDPETQREVQLRRFRAQARRAAAAPYYGQLFHNLGLEPGKLMDAVIVRGELIELLRVGTPAIRAVIKRGEVVR